MGAIVLRPNMFNWWRHFYFIYPGFIFLSALAVWMAWRGTSAHLNGRRMLAARAIIVAVLVIGMGPVAYHMMATHPHQYMYYTFVLGTPGKDYGKKWDPTHFGAKWKEWFDVIMRNDDRERITIALPYNDTRIKQSAFLLEPGDRARIVFKPSDYPADYSFLELHGQRLYYDRVYLKEIYGIHVLSIFKRKSVMPEKLEYE